MNKIVSIISDRTGFSERIIYNVIIYYKRYDYITVYISEQVGLTIEDTKRIINLYNKFKNIDDLNSIFYNDYTDDYVSTYIRY